MGLEGHGEAEVVDGVCVEKDEQCVHEWKKRRRMSWFNVPGGARCGVCVTTTILSAVGPGVKRLYALDTPQSKKNVNLLIEIIFWLNRDVHRRSDLCSVSVWDIHASRFSSYHFHVITQTLTLASTMLLPWTTSRAPVEVQNDVQLIHRGFGAR